MKAYRIFVILLVAVFMGSCGSHRSVATGKASEKSRPALDQRQRELQEGITQHALEYVGTKYRYGGTTHEGMDCSGLIYIAFSRQGIQLPRVSRDMAALGELMELKKVQSGDLLFFTTGKKRKGINHVGLVIRKNQEEIHFIHATTSRGVIVSTLSEKYWQDHFIMARRVL